MIGTNVSGLKEISESVIHAIWYVDNYSDMKMNCKRYFENVNKK